MNKRKHIRKNIFFAAITFFVGLKIILNQNLDKSPSTESYSSRHLLSTAWEQCDFEIGHTRNYSDPDSWYSPASAKQWVILYVFMILIIFVALAVVCDDFFVPSLEAITEKLQLSEDVAGATFMAAGSSAPELFTSIAGVTTESDVGVGTIVGSAVFNLLGICALSAAFSTSELHLDWRPLTRDSIFYALSIGLFIGFAWDGKYEYWESIITLSLYVLYIILMKFNPQLMEFMSRLTNSGKIEPIAAEAEGDGEKKFTHKTGSVSSLISNSKKDEETNLQEDNAGFSEIRVLPCFPPIVVDVPRKQGTGVSSVLRYAFSCILFVMAFPFFVLYTWTIPDCSTAKTRKFYLCSFVMSIAWIAALSFATVTLVGRAGCILNIDKFTMGLVVVAIGTSIPDAMSSVLVARDGYGDMAVSNAIGSNVFDIDLGIGLPFLISSIIRGKAVYLMTGQEILAYEMGEFSLVPHVKFGFILLIILVMSIFIFAFFKFRLNNRLGLSFIILYVVFVAYAYFQDLYCNSKTC